MKRINMSEDTKAQLLKLVRWVITIAATGVFIYFGLGNIPVPPPAEVSIIMPGAAQEVDTPPSPTPEGLVEYGYQTACYLTNGGDKFQCDSGGEIEINEGAILDINGTVTVVDMYLAGDLEVDGATLLNDVVDITGNTEITGTFDVSGLSSLDGGIDVDGLFAIGDGTGNISTTGTLDVDGFALLNSTVDIGGNTTITGTFDVSGAVDFDSTLNVDGDVSNATKVWTFVDEVFIDGVANAIQLLVQGFAGQTADLLVLEAADTTDQFTVGIGGDTWISGTLDVVNGLASLDAGIAVDSAFTVADASGDVVTTGSLDVTGFSLFGDVVDITGNTEITGTFDVSGLSSLDGGIDVDGLFAIGDGTGNISTTGTLDVDGFTLLNDVVDITGNTTITGTLDVSALASLDGGININDVITATAAGNVEISGALDVDGNTTITGTLGVVDTVDLDSTLNVDGDVSNATKVWTFVDNVFIDGVANVIQLLIQGVAGQVADLLVLESADGTDMFTVGIGGDTWISGTLGVDGLASLDGGININSVITATDAGNVEISGKLDVDGNTLITGTLDVSAAVDFDSTLQYGVDNLYPLGYATVAQQMACGVTSTFTGTESVTASALTTATYVIAIQITDPLTTAVHLTVDVPSGNGFDIDSWEYDHTTGTTGITVFWCAVGDQ